MELWLNAWNLFLVLFLITTLFLFLWHSLGGGVREERKRTEGGRGTCLFRSCSLSAKEGDLTDLAEMQTSSREAGAQKTRNKYNENIT